jgi:hypothetical protein
MDYLPRLRTAAGAIALGLLTLISLQTPARADALDNWSPSMVVTNSGYYLGMGLSAVTYGNGRFVAVGAYRYDDSGLVQTSVDGVNWAMPHGHDYSVLDLDDVCFMNGMFVAVGWPGAIYNSTNGQDWSSYSSSSANILAVTSGNGMFVAVGDGVSFSTGKTTNRNIFTSPDGINWTERLSGAGVRNVHAINGVAYGNGRFLAIDDAHYIYTSTTGLSWSKSFLPINSANTALTFCNGQFIVPAGPGSNLISTDGTSWNSLSNNSATTFQKIIYANGCYVAVSGFTTFFTSTDAINWIHPNIQISTNVTFYGATFGAGRFMVVGHYVDDSKYPSQALPVAYISDPIAGLAMTSSFPPQLTLSGLAGRSYRIERNSDLQSSNWQQVATILLSSSPTNWTDPTASNASAFYRSVLLP